MEQIEAVLFLDEQAAIPGRMCPVCKAECYYPGLGCLRCERRMPCPLPN